MFFFMANNSRRRPEMQAGTQYFKYWWHIMTFSIWCRGLHCIIGCQKYLQKHLCHFLLCIPYLLTEISCRILWLYTGCIAYIGTIILSPCHWSWFWSGDQLSVKYWHSRPASSQQLAPGNELKQIIYCKSSQHYYKHTQESRGRGGNQ